MTPKRLTPAPVRFWAVVPAAGAGKRMGSETPKQYLRISGKPVLQHTLERLLSVERLQGIRVALSVGDEYWQEEIPARTHPSIRVAPGGKERADSVYSALLSLENEAEAEDWVLVHDAARLCLCRSDVIKLMETLEQDAVGGLLALPVSDTLKSVDGDLTITASPNRETIWRALTPQMFRYGMLKKALEDAFSQGLRVTDESSAMELAGYRPRIVPGRPDNIKITRPEDLSLAAFYLERQCYE